MAVICSKCKKQYDVTLFQFGRSVRCDCGKDLTIESSEAVEVPINGVLDLHNYKPSELGSLLPEYLKECLERGIFTARIVHGKGKGVLKRAVRSILGSSEYVKSFRSAGHNEGGWGATIVDLKRERKEKGSF